MPGSIESQPGGLLRIATPKGRERELDLLLACATSGHDATPARELAGDLDWGFLVATARAHRWIPLLRRYLAGHPAVPVAVDAELKSAFQASAHRAIYVASQLAELTRALDTAGVESIAYKGPVLGQLAYGDITRRTAGDLDLLVRLEDVVPAAAVLASLGFDAQAQLDEAQFRQHLDEDCEWTLLRPQDQLLVELHWRIVNRNLPFGIGAETLWEPGPRLELHGRSLRVLGPETSLLVLAVHHGVKHFWKKMHHVADLSELLRHGPEIDWERALELARRHRLERTLALGLEMARGLMCAPLPEPAERLRRRAKTGPLAHWAAARMFVTPEPTTSDRERLRVYLGLQPRVADRIRCFHALVLAPRRVDREYLRLPSWAAALHPLVRIVRRLRHRLRGR